MNDDCGNADEVELQVELPGEFSILRRTGASILQGQRFVAGLFSCAAEFEYDAPDWLADSRPDPYDAERIQPE